MRRLAMLVVLGSMCSAGLAADLYVAADGNDANPGTRGRPVATLEKARDLLRTHKVAGVNTVWLSGLIRRDEPFELSALHSGDANSPIIYRSLRGARAVLDAAHPLKASEFKLVTDAAVLARLDPAARGHVLQLDLQPAGIHHAGPYPDVFDDGGGIAQLFCDGTWMPLARWPKQGYTTIAKVLDHGDMKAPNRHGASFIYRDDEPSRWRVESGVWLDGFWRVPWEPKSIRVKSIDPTAHEITFAAPIAGGVGSKYAGPEGSGKENWYAINLLEELNQPGEWCIDFDSKRLFFWPPAPIESAAIELADMQKPLVEMNGVSNVSFCGVVFQGGLGSGMEIHGGTNDFAAGCTFQLLGGAGAIVAGGSHNGLWSCDFHNLGRGGIIMSGGDRTSLTPADNFAVNNHIHHFGLLKKTYAPGVMLGAFGSGDAVGCRVQHNLIHDAPHSAFIYGGNDNLFEYNQVHDIALDSGDVGAFYTWNDWTSRGNMLRYNFVYDSPHANAFYMDDGDSGDTIFANVIDGLSYGPFISGGHDNIVRNNLIVNCQRGIHLDARGLTRGYNATNRGMVGRLKSANYQQPPWSTKYPEILNILEHPDLPTGNMIETNVLVGCKTPIHLGATKDQLRFSTINDNLEMTPTDAGLADFRHHVVRINAGSAIYQKLPAFQPIPFDKIGLYVDEYRLAVAADSDLPTSRRAGGDVFDSNVDAQHSNKPRAP